MKLKDLLVENEVRKRWRNEAIKKYEGFVDKVEEGGIRKNVKNFNLPSTRDELFDYNDIYFDVKVDEYLTVRLRATNNSGGEVEGFVELKSKKGKYGVKKVDSILIVLDMLSFPVLDGIYMEDNPLEVLHKYVVNSLKENNQKFSPWPEREDVLRTFIHEYVEFKKMSSGEDDPNRKGSNYEKLDSDELDARFNETIGWIEDKISRGELDGRLENFETFKEWYFNKFEDLFWDLNDKRKKKLINKLYKWFDSTI